MQTVTLHGKRFHLEGPLLAVNQSIPSITVVNEKLEEVNLDSFLGRRYILATVPSVDTGTCEKEVIHFHKTLAHLKGVEVIVISMDLPFAQKRWCVSQHVDHLHLFSDYKHHSAAKGLGVKIKELGLLSRAVWIVGASGQIEYVQLVSELSHEPDYEAILKHL
jgi:thiol peroxidase